MRHEPTMDVTVPDWVPDQVACAALPWAVPEPVAAAWLLAEGTSRLVVTAEADRLNSLTEKLPGLDITNPDDVVEHRQLQVQTPGSELSVKLGLQAKPAKTDKQNAARSMSSTAPRETPDRPTFNDSAAIKNC